MLAKPIAGTMLVLTFYVRKVMLVTKCNARVCRTDSGNIFVSMYYIATATAATAVIAATAATAAGRETECICSQTHSWSSLFPRYNRERSSGIGRSSPGTRRLDPEAVACGCLCCPQDGQLTSATPDFLCSMAHVRLASLTPFVVWRRTPSVVWRLTLFVVWRWQLEVARMRITGAGQGAKACKVSRRTASRWVPAAFERGRD